MVDASHGLNQLALAVVWAFGIFAAAWFGARNKLAFARMYAGMIQ
jgi:hypothetical protein